MWRRTPTQPSAASVSSATSGSAERDPSSLQWAPQQKKDCWSKLKAKTPEWEHMNQLPTCSPRWWRWCTEVATSDRTTASFSASRTFKIRASGLKNEPQEHLGYKYPWYTWAADVPHPVSAYLQHWKTAITTRTDVMTSRRLSHAEQQLL